MVLRPARLHLWSALLCCLSIPAATTLAQSEAGTAYSPFDRLDASQIPAYEREVAAARLGGQLPEGLVAIFGDSRFRHGAYVSDVVSGPDGQWCVTGGGQSLVVWDLETGEAIRQLPDASGYVIFSIDLSRDGRMLVAGGANNAVTIWDMPEGRLRHRLDTMGGWVALTPDGTRLATGDVGSTELIVWDPRSGERLRSVDLRTVATTLDVGTGTFAIACSHDGSLLASAHPLPFVDGEPPGTRLVIWNAESLEPVRVLGGHDHREMRGLEFSPDDRWLASCAPDGHVKLWNVEAGELQWDFGTVGDRWVQGLEFEQDGESVFALIEDELHEIDVASGRGGTPIKLPFRAASFTLMPDQRHALIATWSWQRIDLETGLRANTHNIPEKINGIAIRPDDAQFAAVADGGKVMLQDVGPGGPARQLEGHDADVTVVAYHPQGQFLVTADSDGRVIFRDPDTGARRDQIRGPNWPQAIALSANGQQLAISDHNQNVDVWDLAIQRHVQTMSGSFGRSSSAMSFLPDGSRLVNGGGIWELGTGQLTQPFFGSDQFLAASPDGARMLVNERLTDLETGNEIATLSGHWHLRSAAFSPDNNRVATLGRGGMLGIWDQRTGALLRFLEVAPRGTDVGPVVWAHDSRHVAFPAGNGTIYVVRVISREGAGAGG